MYVSYSVSIFMYFGYCLYPAVNWISYFAVNSGFWCEEHHPLPRRWCFPGRTRGLLSILHVHGDRYTGIAALPPPHCVMQKISYLDFRKTWHSYEGKSTFFQITKPCHSSFARTWTQWNWVKNNMACFKCHVWITCNAACREDNFTSCRPRRGTSTYCSSIQTQSLSWSWPKWSHLYRWIWQVKTFRNIYSWSHLWLFQKDIVVASLSVKKWL